MQVTDKTIEILKNFSAINNGMVLREGKQQTTVSADDTIFAVAQVDEFPMELGLYELPNFLTNLSLLETPILEFTDNMVKMTDKDGFNLSYRGCAPEIIHTPDPKLAELKFDETNKPDIELNLTLAQLQKLTKVAAVNTFTHLTVFGKDGKLGVKVNDRTSDTSNSGVMVLGDHAGSDFEAVFKVEQLKIIPQTYNVKIKNDAFAIFENADATLKYIIALETKSKKKGKA